MDEFSRKIPKFPCKLMHKNFMDECFTFLTKDQIDLMYRYIKPKQSFLYYCSGVNLQNSGSYDEALEHYFKALSLEEDPIDRSFILYNIGFVYTKQGLYNRALNY